MIHDEEMKGETAFQGSKISLHLEWMESLKMHSIYLILVIRFSSFEQVKEEHRQDQPHLSLLPH
jgi:hypothetical protein